MPTPSIQTLRADAQQVLNLDSISAVRSVVAATLANANAGTPLNPNLTTQQLWNEFYQIVTQPKSDIESIIANQLMKFLYAPPAPGGVGADKQVIFNDGGVLAGDPGLTFDKVTNALTITGDLTVDTSTLKVDSANNRVGIGTAAPSAKLTVLDTNGIPIHFGDLAAAPASQTACFVGVSTSALAGSGNGDLILVPRTSDSRDVIIYTGSGTSVDRFRISGTGICTWSNVGGVAGTAMTLNSTGLGVGDVPTADCKLTVRGGAFINRGASGGASQLLVSLAASSGGNFGQISNTGTRWALGYGPALTTVGTEALIWDSSGNVGIGVAGPNYRLQVNVATGGDRNIFAAQVTGASSGFTVQWNNGTQKLRVNFSDLPTSSAGLPANTLWVDTAAGNTLKLA